MVGIIGNNIIYDLNNLPGQQGCSLLVTITGHVTSQFQFPSIHSSLCPFLIIIFFLSSILPLILGSLIITNSTLGSEISTKHDYHLSLSLSFIPLQCSSRRNTLHFGFFTITFWIVLLPWLLPRLTLLRLLLQELWKKRVSFPLSSLHFYSLFLSEGPVTNEKETWIKNEEQSR